MIKIKNFFLIILIIFFIMILLNKKICIYLRIFLGLLKYNYYKKNYVKYFKKFNKNVAYKILDDVSKILEKHNIFFWLSEGTALGIYRNNDLIDDDDDVDISFRSEYLEIFKDKVIHDVEKLGYTVDYINNQYYIFNEEITMDIDILFKNETCLAKYNRPVKELEPHIKDFYIKEFRGFKYNLPKESYYEYIYGKDYMIPLRKKPDFSFF